MHDGHGWMWQNGWGWGDLALMTVVMVVFWAAVITVVVLAVRYLRSHRGSSIGPLPGPSANRAEDVLAERYARGEI